MSDPLLSDTDYKNKMAWVWTPLKIFSRSGGKRQVVTWGHVIIFEHENNLPAYERASSVGTALRCRKSDLFPTSIITMLLSAWSLSSFSHLSTFSYLEMIFSERMILFILTSCAWQYRRLKELQRLRGNRQLWWRGNVLVRLYPRSVLLLFCPRPKIKGQVMSGLPGRDLPQYFESQTRRRLSILIRDWIRFE